MVPFSSQTVSLRSLGSCRQRVSWATSFLWTVGLFEDSAQLTVNSAPVQCSWGQWEGSRNRVWRLKRSSNIERVLASWVHKLEMNIVVLKTELEQKPIHSPRFALSWISTQNEMPFYETDTLSIRSKKLLLNVACRITLINIHRIEYCGFLNQKGGKVYGF